jgi:flagellar assembly factor FliW
MGMTGLRIVAAPDPIVASNAPRDVLFPYGLVGYPDWREFVLRERDDLPGIWTLELRDSAVRAFTLIAVDEVEPGFFDALAPDDMAALAALGVDGTDGARVFCTLTFHARGAITANLLGPLVIDLQHAIGTQIVLAASPWTTRQPVAMGQD